mgnify:CR=1 FL=1
MHFERDVKAYAEPVSNEELREGSIYFFVNFVDDEMTTPTMETVVFVGRNLEPNDSGRVYFQDIDSFNRGVRYDTATEGDYAVFQAGSEKELGHIFDFDHALDVLIACSVRRRKAGGKSAG